MTKDDLIVLDGNIICDKNARVCDYTKSDKLLTVDYKDKLVLQFTTLDANGDAEIKFKFLKYDDKLLDKGPKDVFKKEIKYTDIVSDKMKALDKSLKDDGFDSKFFEHLKFYNKNVLLNGKKLKQAIHRDKTCTPCF